MGSVADKIAKKILSSRGSKVVDLASWREGRKMAIQAGFGDDGLALGKLAGRPSNAGGWVVQQFIESVKVASRAVIAVVVLVCASLLLAGAASAKPLDPECVAYMEADAIYEEVIAATEPSGILAPVSEGLLGASKEIEAARQDAEFKRLQAYQSSPRCEVCTASQLNLILGPSSMSLN